MTDFAKKQDRFTTWWDKALKEERYKLFRAAFGEGAAYELLDLLEIAAWETVCWFSPKELYALLEALPDQQAETTGL